MTIYSYHCTECGANIEKNVKMVDRNNQLCEKCGSKTPMKIQLVESSSGNNLVSGVNFRKKVPCWMKDRLHRLKKDSGSICKMDL